MKGACYIMEKIKRINARIKKQQTGRFIVGMGSIILGTMLIKKFMYQRGFTDCQKAISECFPDEYALMTVKIIKAFDKE